MPCATCGKVIQKYKMALHIQMAHTAIEDRKYQCPYCQKGFANKRRYDDHINTHTGNKPYLCKDCGHADANYDNYLKHVRQHKKELPTPGPEEPGVPAVPVVPVVPGLPLPPGLQMHPLFFGRKD